MMMSSSVILALFRLILSLYFFHIYASRFTHFLGLFIHYKIIHCFVHKNMKRSAVNRQRFSGSFNYQVTLLRCWHTFIIESIFHENSEIHRFFHKNYITHAREPRWFLCFSMSNLVSRLIFSYLRYAVNIVINQQ